MSLIRKLLTPLSLLLTLLAPALADTQTVYVSSGDQVEVYRLDPESGKLSSIQQVELTSAGPMTTSADRKRLYVVANHAFEDGAKPGPALATYDVAADGQLKLSKIAPANLRPGYLKLDATETFLAGNHYGPGKVTIWKLEDGVYQGETVQEVTLEPKAHSSVFSSNNRWLLVPATGPNKVFQLAFDAETGMATPNDPPFAAGPKGDDEARQPRHFIFHPELDIAYTTNERELPGVGVWSWDAEKGQLKTIQNIVSLPEGWEGTITTADLHLSPDNKFLFISNRDLTDRKATTGDDTIVTFAVDPKTGLLEFKGHSPCPHIPRSFALDATGSFAYVAGQGDDRLGTYRIDAESGLLSEVEIYETSKRPSWVHIMKIPGTN